MLSSLSMIELVAKREEAKNTLSAAMTALSASRDNLNAVNAEFKRRTRAKKAAKRRTGNQVAELVSERDMTDAVAELNLLIATNPGGNFEIIKNSTLPGGVVIVTTVSHFHVAADSVDSYLPDVPRHVPTAIPSSSAIPSPLAESILVSNSGINPVVAAYFRETQASVDAQKAAFEKAYLESIPAHVRANRRSDDRCGMVDPLAPALRESVERPNTSNSVESAPVATPTSVGPPAVKPNSVPEWR